MPVAINTEIVTKLRSRADSSGRRHTSPYNTTARYSGPSSGVGSRYAWQGNKKAGQGSMEITSSTPELIVIRLEFLKPWKATNDVVFTLEPSGSGTEVTWVMTGEHAGLGKVFSKVFSMDKLIGKDFEKGLARLKAVSETGD